MRLDGHQGRCQSYIVAAFWRTTKVSSIVAAGSPRQGSDRQAQVLSALVLWALNFHETSGLVEAKRDKANALTADSVNTAIT